ncbi:hypothetical protein IF1G_10846 [Cordyceps javanica]|uniref:Uncharacterized protein n=1 Tax=Cordyceps javanica TaxID=43265 RepID=A0A545UM41_9HYPO|nr:hypothetical protein IF1G_10846 [Cordyceps javanica]
MSNIKNNLEGNSAKSGNAKSHEVQGDEAEPDEAEHDDTENEAEHDDAENKPQNDGAENDDAENDGTENDDTENEEAKNGQQAASENEDCQMSDCMQPHPGVANADIDGLTADNTEIIYCGESQDMSGPLTPPGTNAPALGAHQAQSTAQIPGSVPDIALLAPPLDCSSPASCPPASDTDKEHKVMEAIFLCCLQFTFQLSRKKMQMRYTETIFWHFIEEIAKDIKPEDCPVPRGPLDGFTRQEKKAHKQFMVDAGYKTGLTNVRHYRLLWKHLYTLREGGVDKILLYRTKEFTSFCESFRTDADPSLLDTVMLWEEKYGPQIELLERRIEYTVKNKMGEDPLRRQPDIAGRLMVVKQAWNSDSNRWHSEQEASDFKAAHGPLLADNVPLGDFHDLPTKKGQNRDMSMFVTLKSQGMEKIMMAWVRHMGFRGLKRSFG